MPKTTRQPLSFGDCVVRISLLSLISLIALPTMTYFIENWRGERSWRQVVEAHAAAGDPIYLSAAESQVADSNNFAATPLLAPLAHFRWTNDSGGQRRFLPVDVQGFERIQAIQLPKRKEDPKLFPTDNSEYALLMRRRDGRIDLAEWQKLFRETPGFNLPKEPDSPATDVLLALSRWNAELSELESASRRPQCHFKNHFDDWPGLWAPYISPMQAFGNIVELRCAARLAVGKVDEALADIEFEERLGMARNERAPFRDHLFADRIKTAATHMYWEGLVDDRWIPDQLVHLQSIFEARNPRPEMLRALQADRWNAILELEHFLEEAGPIWKDRPDWPTFEDSFRGLLEVATGRGWVRQNEITVVSQYDLWSSVQRLWLDGDMTSPDAVIELKNEVLTARPIAYRFLADYLLQDRFVASMTVADRLVAISRMAVLSCALERFHIEKGKYPDSLDDLKSEFLPTLPLDPCNGMQFVYKSTQDGRYSLYSVGPDGEDDGGVSSSGQSSNFDWVWPTTAFTPEKLF
jgi:hypothetical protein